VKLKPSVVVVVVILFSLSFSPFNPSEVSPLCVRHKLSSVLCFPFLQFILPKKKKKNTPSFILLVSNTITILFNTQSISPSLPDVFTNNKIIISAIKLLNPSDLIAYAQKRIPQNHKGFNGKKATHKMLVVYFKNRNISRGGSFPSKLHL